MNIAIIGVGNVGRTLGPRWAAAGHAINYVVRDPDDSRHRPLLDSSPGAQLAAAPAAVSTADVVLIAVPWAAAEAVARSLQPGPDTIVIDATNQLLPGFSGLDPAVTPSAGELIAQWTGSSRVVKAFSTTGSANMADTSYSGGTPAMFLAGDDAAAKTVVGELAAALGFDPVDVGPLAESHSLEELALLWIRLAYIQGKGPGFAFAVLRRP